MEGRSLLDELPEPYAVALVLRGAGLSTTEVAAHLALPDDVTVNVLRLAERRVHRSLHDEDTTEGDD